MSQASTSEGGWPGGWIISAVAGVVAAVLARWIGDVGMTAAVMVGLVAVLVFGVLLGMFWTAPATGGDAGHGHDDHGHGHDDHAHAPVAAAPVLAAPEPAVQMAPVMQPEPTPSEAKPAGLTAPRGGTADALQTIEGIGPVLEKLCHELGIYHFDQIAAWGQAEIAWMDSNLKGFKGRVSRDRWVRQASLIAEVGLDDFKRRAKTNDY